jgi:opacity protein-like surface antigen
MGPTRAEQLRADSIARADSLARVRTDTIARAEQLTRDSIAAAAAAVERARVDSIAAIEKARADSIAAVERVRRDSVARADSLAREVQLRQERERNRYLFNGSGWYIGVSGGSSMPMGDFEDLGYDRGLNVNVPFGWHNRNSLLGVRFDLGYNRFVGSSFVGSGPAGSVTLDNSDPTVFTGTANLTARLPLGSVGLYGVGGGGVFHFRNFGAASSLSGLLGNDVLDPVDEASEKAKTKFGWTYGAGIDFGVGPTSLFLETRVVNVVADRDDAVQFRDFFGSNRGGNVRWMPIVLGVTFR